MIKAIKTNSFEEWKELRSHYIGGSDAAAVVGLNHFCSPYTLWAIKAKRIPEFEGNLATEVGEYLEEFVAQKFTEETGKKVRRNNRSLINEEYPWAIANIDREIVGEDAGLEIKTTSELNLKRFKNGEYPDSYYVQCVHYLAVTGKERWYLAVLIGNKEFKWFVIERDEEEIQALMDAEREFWHLVETDTAPPADGTKSTTKTIKTLFADSDDTQVDLSAYDTALQTYIRLGRQIDELEQLREDAANKVKAYMAEAGRGESNSFKVSWTTSYRNTFDARRFASDHPELDLTPYYNTSKTRTFRVTEKKEK